MNTSTALKIVQSIALVVIQRNVKPTSPLIEGYDLLADMLAEKFPELKKFVLSGYGENDSLTRALNGGNCIISHDQTGNTFQVKVTGGGHYVMFTFSRFEQGSKDEYSFIGADLN